MESRSRWRKDEDGVRQGVAGLIDALREGLGAEALALFDDDRARPEAERDPGQLSFWDAFSDLPCVELDWPGHYATLRATGRFETACACPARHGVRGFLIHQRWILVLIAPKDLAPGAAAALTSGLSALADRLPPGKPPSSDDDAWYREEARAPSGGGRLPVWWIRPPRG